MGAAEITAQFERLEGNVSAALSAVASKGVAIPSGSTSDNLASLIASIIVLDLSVVTVTPETLAEGVTAYDASGNLITGTAQIVEDSGGGYTNMVPLSIDTDGSIYNSVGYKDGYRIRSGGAESTQSKGTCTGFIPVSGGDTVRIYGWDRINYSTSAANAINVADSSFTNLGQVGNSNYGIFASGGGYAAYDKSTIYDGADGVSKWVVPPAASGAAYIRVSAYNDGVTDVGSQLIVTVNEEIT